MPVHSLLIYELTKVIRQFYPVSTLFILRLKELTNFVECEADEILLHYKETQQIAWFQLSGSTVELTVDPITKAEITTFFWFYGDFVCSTPGFFSQQPSQSYIKTIDKSTFISISSDNFNILKNGFEETELLSEIMRDHYKMLKAKHSIDMRLSAKTRTKKLYDQHPILFQKCSKKQLASFLKMNPDTLTRMMKNLEIYN